MNMEIKNLIKQHGVSAVLHSIVIAMGEAVGEYEDRNAHGKSNACCIIKNRLKPLVEFAADEKV